MCKHEDVGMGGCSFRVLCGDTDKYFTFVSENPGLSPAFCIDAESLGG